MTIIGYLDPGTGSMLLQILLGGAAAVGVTAKLYWHRIRRIFGGRSEEPGSSAESSRDDPTG